jgi:hypothetical protein
MSEADERKLTPPEMRVLLESEPLFDGVPPWWELAEWQKRPRLIGEREPDATAAYETVARSIAHAFLVLLDERPALPEEAAEAGTSLLDVLWPLLVSRWPNAPEWCGHPTGFQVGWACNAALYCHSKPGVPNPAIVEIEIPDQPEPEA